MKFQNILLVGGSGFIGTHVAERLVARGMSVRIPTRHRERAKHLLTLPTAEVIEADVHDPKVLSGLCAGMDAVINLAGILHSASGEPYGRQFREVHEELPKQILPACRQQNVHRLLQMSALGAAADAPSEYLRSKAAGEAAVMGAGDDVAVTVFRPSVVFGPEDKFLNQFAQMQRLFPIILLPTPEARLQPVFVDDVADVIYDAIARVDAHGAVYDLVGPEVFTLRRLVHYTGVLTGHERPIIGLPDSLGYLLAAILEWKPGRKLLSRDNLRSTKVDSVSNAPFPFGIARSSIEAIAPEYLSGVTPRIRYMMLRGRAGR